MRYPIAILLVLPLSLAASNGYSQPAEPAAPSSAGDRPAVPEAVAPAPEPSPALVVAAPPPTAPPPSATPPPVAFVPVKSKWSLTIAGFLQIDAIYDSTQSFLDNTGGTLVQRPNTYLGDHDRMTMSFRNSRFGVRLGAPDFWGVKASGFIEFDFLGNQPGGITEPAFFSNATMRARHVYLKLESEYVDLLFGQTWHLFGWQPYYNPNTAELQGVPGQLFSRSVQLRLSHMFKTDPLNVDVAAAAARPAQRDSAIPDGQGGIRFLLNGVKALHINGNGGAQSVDPLSIAVSGLVRQFRVKDFVANPKASMTATGWAVAIDALIPIIPASADDTGNKLTVQGSFQTGSGFNDQYLAFSGGITFPTLMSSTAATYAPNVDSGLVTYDAAGQLHTIDWTVYLAGLQYYFPPSGKVWISVNVSQLKSGNIATYGPPTGVFKKELWADGCLFWQTTAAVRFGVEYARFRQTYGDNVVATNHRAQFTGWFAF
jgi:hypothetical protein